jgi:histidyl-tRNA synthetase
MFRYERPGAGRQRQFHQLGVEVLGSPDPRADVEVIAIATDILQTLGLKDLRLDINSVGNLEDRPRYRQALVDYLTPYKDELDPEAPSILDYLGAYSQQHFEKVQQLLTDLGISYKLNPCLVRGLDYYTHTAFEIQSDDLGAQATVCGGGRYDGLVKELGGAETPAVGWAIGLERLVLLLQQLSEPPRQVLDFYVVSRGEEAEAQALKLAQKLRQTGFAVELDLSGSAFGKQFKRADRSGAVACLVLGDAEAENRTVNLKWLKSGEQQAIAQAELLEKTDELRRQIDSLK